MLNRIVDEASTTRLQTHHHFFREESSSSSSHHMGYILLERLTVQLHPLLHDLDPVDSWARVVLRRLGVYKPSSCPCINNEASPEEQPRHTPQPAQWSSHLVTRLLPPNHLKDAANAHHDEEKRHRR